MRKIIFTLSIILIINITFAQNPNKKIAFGAGFGIADFGGFYNSEFKNTTTALPHIYFGVNAIKPLNISTSIEAYKLDNYQEVLDNNKLWKWNLGLQYRFLSFLEEKYMIADPYIYASSSLLSINKEINLTVNAGIGVNVWIAKSIGIFLESGYVLGGNGFPVTTIGLKIRIGKKEKVIEDRDNDGIPDATDLCPDTPGVAELDGCPKVTDSEIDKFQKSISGYAKRIKFEFADTKFTKESYAALDSIVSILKKNRQIKISIKGHTDNTGSETFNMTLSRERADEVRKYMSEKGVGYSRIHSLGFGGANPLFDNLTKVGREKNRRIEIQIVK